MPKCCACEEPAVLVDTEYDEPYCEECADTYRVKDGPWRYLPDDSQPT